MPQLEILLYSQKKFICMTCSRDGTGHDFLDPTGKFQNIRRLTGRFTGGQPISDRPGRPVFLQKVFVYCSMHLMKNFQKEEAWARC